MVYVQAKFKIDFLNLEKYIVTTVRLAGKEMTVISLILLNNHKGYSRTFPLLFIV